MSNNAPEVEHIVVLDIEHTCTGEGENPISQCEREIIEIGAVIVSNDDFVIVSEFEQLICPTLHPNITEFCSRLTGITQDMLCDKPRFSEGFALFRQWLPNEFIFATWGAYDLRQINIDCHNSGLEGFAPEAVINLKKEFSKKKRLKPWVGLQRALSIANIESEGRAHRALDDAKSAASLLPHIFT